MSAFRPSLCRGGGRPAALSPDSIRDLVDITVRSNPTMTQVMIRVIAATAWSQCVHGHGAASLVRMILGSDTVSIMK